MEETVYVREPAIKKLSSNRGQSGLPFVEGISKYEGQTQSGNEKFVVQC